jgi:hypothetical protein
MSFYALLNVKETAGIFSKAPALNLTDLQNYMQIQLHFKQFLKTKLSPSELVMTPCKDILHSLGNHASCYHSTLNRRKLLNILIVKRQRNKGDKLNEETSRCDHCI